MGSEGRLEVWYDGQWWVETSTAVAVVVVVESEGRLEVWYGGLWWSVCDDRWTMTNTDMVCREMGLGRGIAFLPRYDHAHLFRTSTVAMGFDDVRCDDDVTSGSFFRCSHAPFGFPPDCDERQTIGVRCAGATRNSAYCVAECPVVNSRKYVSVY